MDGLPQVCWRLQTVFMGGFAPTLRTALADQYASVSSSSWEAQAHTMGCSAGEAAKV